MATLSGLTPGAPDNSYQDLLQTVGATRATGASVSWGDGTQSALVLWETGVGVSNGSFVTRFNTDATAARTITAPDASGTMLLADGTGITDGPAFRQVTGSLFYKLTADFSNATDVYSTVTSFELGSLKASTSYHFKIILLAQSASAASGMIVKVNGPAETADVAYHYRDNADQLLEASAFGVDLTSAGFDLTDTTELVMIEGLFVTTASAPTSSLSLQIKSETDAVAVTIKKGSLLVLTEY